MKQAPTIYCPLWGLKHLPFETAMTHIADAGYDGVEMAIPAHIPRARLGRWLQDEFGLLLVAQQCHATGDSFPQYRENYLQYLRTLIDAEPVFINSHTGRDSFSFEQNLQLLLDAQALSDAGGVPIVHELHRGRFSYSPQTFPAYVEAVPALQLTADLSHWCVVSESLLERHGNALACVFERAVHIHARVGHANGPQVSDPRAPEWQSALEAHLGWWDAIMTHAREEGRKVTFTPEFGPPTYMPTCAWSQLPVGDQWEINVYMKNLLRERYAQIPGI